MFGTNQSYTGDEYTNYGKWKKTPQQQAIGSADDYLHAVNEGQSAAQVQLERGAAEVQRSLSAQAAANGANPAAERAALYGSGQIMAQTNADAAQLRMQEVQGALGLQQQALMNQLAIRQYEDAKRRQGQQDAAAAADKQGQEVGNILNTLGGFAGAAMMFSDANRKLAIEALEGGDQDEALRLLKTAPAEGAPQGPPRDAKALMAIATDPNVAPETRFDARRELVRLATQPLEWNGREHVRPEARMPGEREGVLGYEAASAPQAPVRGKPQGIDWRKTKPTRAGDTGWWDFEAAVDRRAEELGYAPDSLSDADREALALSVAGSPMTPEQKARLKTVQEASPLAQDPEWQAVLEDERRSAMERQRLDDDADVAKYFGDTPVVAEGAQVPGGVTPQPVLPLLGAQQGVTPFFAPPAPGAPLSVGTRRPVASFEAGPARALPPLSVGARRPIASLTASEDPSLTQRAAMDDATGGAALQGYSFEYDGTARAAGAPPGPQTGVMAQNLEQNPVTAPAVVDTPVGKVVDTGKLTTINSALIGRLGDRLDELDARTRAVTAAPVDSGTMQPIVPFVPVVSDRARKRAVEKLGAERVDAALDAMADDEPGQYMATLPDGQRVPVTTLRGAQELPQRYEQARANPAQYYASGPGGDVLVPSGYEADALSGVLASDAPQGQYVATTRSGARIPVTSQRKAEQLQSEMDAVPRWQPVAGRVEPGVTFRTAQDEDAYVRARAEQEQADRDRMRAEQERRRLAERGLAAADRGVPLSTYYQGY